MNRQYAKTFPRTAPGYLSICITMCLFGCHTSPPVGSITTKILEPYNLSVPAIDAKDLQITQSSDLYQEATPIEPFAMPELPKEWAKQVTMPLQIVIKVHIDDHGRVVGFEESLRNLTPSTEFVHTCKDAIRTAVSTWRFRPAIFAHVEPSADGRPVITSERNVDTSLEIAFTLTSSKGLDFDVRGK